MADQKNIVITGASGGIGTALVKRLDSLGWQVFAGVRREADGARLCQVASARVVPVLLDITEEVQVAAATQAIARHVGSAGVQALINNAGMIVEGPLELVPLNALRQQFEVNVIGQIAVTQALLPLLRQGQGRVVNIGAATGRVAVPFLGPIAASKSALESLTDALRMELSPWNISVSIVEPGAIETPIFAKSNAAADARLAAMPEKARQLYAQAVQNARAAMAKGGADRIEVVVAAIEQALTARQPKTRYVVGKGASALVTLRLLPDRMRDGLLMGQLGMPKQV